MLGKLARISITAASATALVGLGLFLGIKPHEDTAFAESTGGTVQAAAYLQEPRDGMAQYGAGLEQCTSPVATLQAVSD